MAPYPSALCGDPAGPPAEADVVIVGGGLAGLEVARELDIAGADGVVVVEAGPARELAHVNAARDPGSALTMWLNPENDDYFWRPWTPERSPHYDRTAGLRRRLGGRSLYWHGVTLPIEDWALCEPHWPGTVVGDLTRSWRGGPSLYDSVRADLAEWRGAGETGGPAPSLTVGAVHFTETPRAVRPSPGGGPGRWSAYTPLAHWAERPDGAGRRADGSAGVRIAPGCEVLGLVLSGDRVTGVKVRDGSGGTRVIGCRRAVLAAGTVESTRLAIQALRSAGALTGDRLTGLADHLVQGFLVVLDPEAVPAELRALAESDAFLMAPCGRKARSNMFLRLYRNAAGGVVFDAWCMGEQLPGPRNTVRCAVDGEWPWKVFVSAGLGPDDERVVAAQREELERLWADLCTVLGGARRPLGFPEFDDPASMLENLLPAVDAMAPTGAPVTWSGPLGSEYHEACTLPFGTMVDDRHRLTGVHGLHVAGPAVFPRAGAANPSLTTLSLSRRLARLLEES